MGSGNAGASSMNPDPDAGIGTLQGNVLLLTDDSFAQATLFTGLATVSADGANGSPVTAKWDGHPPADPFMLEAVARVATNWLSVKPEQAGDALPTYQAVQTNQVTNVNLGMVSSTVLDGIFNKISSIRSPDSGQAVLFFRNAGTGVPLSGLHASMVTAQAAIYSTATGWVLDDGTALTSKDGLVVFGNVEPANSSGTQMVTITRAATATSPAAAAGQFPVRIVQGAVTVAGIDVQL